MPSTENLFAAEAAEKIQTMIGSGGTILYFCCNFKAAPIDATPLAVQGVDDDGTVWFFSTRDSDRNTYVKQDNRVQLLYGDSGSSDYLSIYGEAEVMNDPVKTKELWTPFAKAWFTEGPTDPKLSLIRFVPKEGFYWDTKHGKMIAMAKRLVSVVTGTTMDDSVDGKLKL